MADREGCRRTIAVNGTTLQCYEPLSSYDAEAMNDGVNSLRTE